MAQLGTTFDPAEVPPDERSFDLLPNGQYEAQIIESDIVPTKNNGGKMLKLTWEIVAGAFERRKVWQQLNIQNQSAEAQRIGSQQLAQICEATGAGAISDSEQLHFKPCIITLAVEKGSGEYADKNKVSRVKPIGGGSAAARPSQQQAARPASAAIAASPPSQQRAAAAGSRPWGNR